MPFLTGSAVPRVLPGKGREGPSPHARPEGAMLLTKRLSIQSKLILLLLVVSLGSMIPIAVLGFRSGRGAIERTGSNHLSSLRQAKVDQIRTRLQHIRRQVITLAEDRMLVDAMKEFSSCFDKLQR